MNIQFIENHKSQLDRMVARIVERVPVEKVWLLGYTLMGENLESIFRNSPENNSRAGHYYLLVLINPTSNMNKDAMQDKIENNCRTMVPATAIVLDSKQFNKWVLEAPNFSRLVHEKAMLLYGSVNVSLPIKKIAATKLNHTATSGNWTEAVNKVNVWINAAEVFILRHQNRMAICMLQIAVKLALQGIFKSATGLCIRTNNIDKWLRYCSMISFKIPKLFPKDTDKNKRLFALLQKADLVKGYTDELRVYKTDLAEILGRVKKLQQLMLELNTGPSVN